MKGLYRYAGAAMVVAWVFLLAVTTAADEGAAPAPVQDAKEIGAAAGISENHPEFEEGMTCADCHQIKIDAGTTATQVWMHGDYANFSKGEGGMAQNMIKDEIAKVVGGLKTTRTFVIATCVNNTPLSSTAEFTLDPNTMTLYGIHEKGTEKLLHIVQNPRVSLNWHEEFTDFSKTLCVQFIGTAQLFEGTDPEFDRILKEVIPYERRADAQKIPHETCRNMFKQMMLISKTTVDQATITNAQFRKLGAYRPWQRWVRQQAQATPNPAAGK